MRTTSKIALIGLFCFGLTLLAPSRMQAESLTGAAEGGSSECHRADITRDLVVDVLDLLELLLAWGTNDPRADLNSDGTVDVQDLLVLLTCPWGDLQRLPACMNLAGLREWHPIVFADIVKQSRTPLMSRNADLTGAYNTGYGHLAQGEDGWPNVEIPFDVNGVPQILHTVLVRDYYWGPGGPFPPVMTADAARFPAGDYTVSFEGDGEIQVLGGGGTPLMITDNAPHTYTVPTPDQNGLFIRIFRSSASNPVRNIKFMLPGYSVDETQNPYGPFYAPYVELLRTFSVLRFMGWMNANDHPCTNGVSDPGDPTCLMEWSGRTLTSYRSQGGNRGVAVEYLVDLANHVGSDPWITVPHAADDDYVEQMAQIVASRLDPQRQVYVEYSNEVWNGIFDAFHYARAKGTQLWNPANIAVVQAWYARRSSEIFCIFRNAGISEQRLVTVVSGQYNNPWVGSKILQYWNDPAMVPNPCGVQLDAYGVGAYFSPEDEYEAEENDTIEELFEKMRLTTTQGRFHRRITENNDLATEYDVELIAYEGGQHLVEYSTNSSLQLKFAQMNRDPRIMDAYRDAHQKWTELTGGTLYAYFVEALRVRDIGAFGHVEYVDQQPYREDADGLRPYKLEVVREIIFN